MHWHPVLLGKQLGRRPVAVRIDNTDLVIFRTATGQAAALADVCPHRRMRLSMGDVIGQKLRCLYHGWTFDAAGRGESPGTPKLHACATAYDVVERYGAIWVKSLEAAPRFPHLDVHGFYNICNLQHSVRAPLELVVDNFCEIEHTPTTHAVFGYPLDRMHEVKVEFQATDTTVRVINQGPCKRLPAPLRWLLGVGKDYYFMDDWTTHFSPVYSVYDHWWQCPRTGRPSRVRWRLFIFFVPIDDHACNLFTFAYTKSCYPGPAGGARLFKWLMRRRLDHEIRLDIRVLEGLADHNPSIEGMKLSRFDKSLGLNRERIERIYRGRNALRLAG
ncbi:MAG: Rieske 2Fe-2S domain-containing protein [Gemmataceae bacterium]|nr:Rieske 2Fe-2S domain-containing protein [Gemmataceae bacterium]